MRLNPGERAGCWLIGIVGLRCPNGRLQVCLRISESIKYPIHRTLRIVFREVGLLSEKSATGTHGVGDKVNLKTESGELTREIGLLQEVWTCSSSSATAAATSLTMDFNLLQRLHERRADIAAISISSWPSARLACSCRDANDGSEVVCCELQPVEVVE